MIAEAVLITDADHAVPVIVSRNGLRTIAVGTGDTGKLRLPYLTNSADIQPGDLLLSSGLGGVFPSGYPVGRVSEVRRRPGQSFASVIAEPAAALDRDREVLLVWTGDDDPSGLAATGTTMRRAWRRIDAESLPDTVEAESTKLAESAGAEAHVADVRETP